MRRNEERRSEQTEAVGLSSVEAAVAALRRGEMIVVIDARDRENEGDLVMAAEKATPEAVNFMARHGRGLICTPMSGERLDELGIPPMAAVNRDSMGTAFHVGVDHCERTSTGISATDRAETIRALASPASEAADFTMPGHVFPLAAREGGVLERPGHTEAAIDLMTVAGLAPAGVICEILREDGRMERYPGLVGFARRHRMPILAISDLIAYRLRAERSVTRTGESRLPLGAAEFTAFGYRDGRDDAEHLALVLGDPASCPAPLVRLHSECLAGDVFGSGRCDCGEQLRLALEEIAAEGCGAVVYLRGQEGGGIGFGQAVGARDYRAGAQILCDLGIERLRLLSNNPLKASCLEANGVRVLDRIPLQAPALLSAVGAGSTGL